MSNPRELTIFSKQFQECRTRLLLANEHRDAENMNWQPEYNKQNMQVSQRDSQKK